MFADTRYRLWQLLLAVWILVCFDQEMRGQNILTKHQWKLRCVLRQRMPITLWIVQQGPHQECKASHHYKVHDLHQETYS